MASNCSDSPAALFRVWPSYEPTPLVEFPVLAECSQVAKVFVKDESRRPLGSFKALGGMYAGLRALARASRSAGIEALVSNRGLARSLPTLICASDGNHGLAVAAAAELAGATSRVYLHGHVPQSRARRIASRGATVVWIDGTYDDAVDAAAQAAARGEGLLISDTSTDPNDPTTADVMAGYSLMADEIASQLRAHGDQSPTHLFIQAGVGGLAAALAHGLCETHGQLCRVVVVEPERAACVGHALKLGRIERLPGDLQTAAEMLSCGEASAPAVEILRRAKADAITVCEQRLTDAVQILSSCGGPSTTPSGATGLAGLLSLQNDPALAQRLSVSPQSRVLLVVTEGIVPTCE